MLLLTAGFLYAYLGNLSAAAICSLFRASGKETANKRRNAGASAGRASFTVTPVSGRITVWKISECHFDIWIREDIGDIGIPTL